MKKHLKKYWSLMLTVGMVGSSLIACGGNESTSASDTSISNTNSELENVATVELPTIDSLNLGEDYTELTADIKFLTFRTDIIDKLNGYITEFNKDYPNITITYEGVDDYENDVLMRLSSTNDWGQIMMIPLGISKEEASEYFISYGDTDVLSDTYNFTSTWDYNGDTYGIASTGNAYGILYNRKVFKDAGVTEIPKSPDEFINALTLIKENTDAIPLYTNYADAWPMSGWDAYIGIDATGDATYMNQVLVHASNPFANQGDGTHPYAVYKILYDAVAQGLTEDDYTTTSEERSYGMLNNGEIGTLAFASWACVQAAAAGNNPDDIGYMPFPITINGKQYVGIGPDYCYGINKNASIDEQIASMLYVKWLTEKSGYAYSEGGIPIVKGEKMPSFYDDLAGIELIEDEPALKGEESYFNDLNSETGLGINANGNDKGQAIVEHAFAGDLTFDEIMEEWNQKWKEAQDKLGIERRE